MCMCKAIAPTRHGCLCAQVFVHRLVVQHVMNMVMGHVETKQRLGYTMTPPTSHQMELKLRAVTKQITAGSALSKYCGFIRLQNITKVAPFVDNVNGFYCM